MRLSLFCVFLIPAFFLAQPARAANDTPSTTDTAEIVHVLNRITFGPRVQDIADAQKMGLDAYIDQQLHPEGIDDSATEQDVAQLDLLKATPSELSTLYRDEQKKILKKAKENLAAGKPADQAQGNETATPAMLNQINGWKSVAVVGQLQQGKLVRAVESKRQLQEVLVDFWSNHFNVDVKKGPDRVLAAAYDRDTIRPHILGKFRDLLEATAKSPAMLFYLDNAENSLPREVGPVELAIQKAAMKMALGDVAAAAAPPLGKKQGGINENYAREIMELHTMGVDGGYTQQDVQEVARCFTGWTLDRLTGAFRFTPRRHDEGSKLVLGHVIPPNGGMADGEKVLDILCAQPATAHFISKELCQRFVSDDPPEALVGRIATVFTQTEGDLRQVVQAILTSPEFRSPDNFRNKIKSPLEFAVSAIRATQSSFVAVNPPPFDKIKPTIEGAATLNRMKASDRLEGLPRKSLNWHIHDLGEPLFACSPPTGYKEVSKIWVSPGALIERLNFALALTQQKVEDARFSPKNVLPDTDLDQPEAVLDQCVASLLQGDITAQTRKVLTEAALPSEMGQTVDPAKVIALILGSPEFQRK